MTKCLWPWQAARRHYWTKPFPVKVRLVSLKGSHCQGWLGRQSGFLQIFFFACHSCFIALWKEGRPTRSRSGAYIFGKLNERQKNPYQTSPQTKRKLYLWLTAWQAYLVASKNRFEGLTFYSPLACMLFTVTKNLREKLEGRAFCKYFEYEKHALSSRLVIPCWEQLRKPCSKSSLAAGAFRVNHSEVIQNASFTLYNMRQPCFGGQAERDELRLGWEAEGWCSITKNFLNASHRSLKRRSVLLGWEVI